MNTTAPPVRQQVSRAQGMLPVVILPEICNGCGACITRCSTGALSRDANGNVIVDAVYCLGIGGCMKVCPVQAIRWAPV